LELFQILTKSKELQQGSHFQAVSTTGIQREALKFKKADRSITDKNSALQEETVTVKMQHQT
jgi:hypothetical protein